MIGVHGKQSAENAIITVGFCPCWDVTCRVEGIEWGEHKRIASQSAVPAGKALNISKAMNWLGIGTAAAGLWGQSDYPQMLETLKADYPLITPCFTVVSGKTRQNITLIDTKAKREMHLRADCRLAVQNSLRQLKTDLDNIVTPASTVVFAGAIPDGFLDECLSLIKHTRDKGAKIAVDTSGSALKEIIKIGGLSLIKPNLEELCQLLGRPIQNEVASIVEASRSLCNSVNIILVSRGADGALAITSKDAFQCYAKTNRFNVVNTVGCGDYLLAGFLSQMDAGDIHQALLTGVKVATAKACGFSETTSWPTVDRKFDADIFTY